MRRKRGTSARKVTRTGRQVRRGRLVVRPLLPTGSIDADELVLDQVHDAGGALGRIAIDATGEAVCVAVVGERAAVSTNGRSFYRRSHPAAIARSLVASDGALAIACTNPIGLWWSRDDAATWRRIEIPSHVVGSGHVTALHRDRFGTWWLGTSYERLLEARQLERGWRQAPFPAGRVVEQGIAEVDDIGDAATSLWVHGVGWAHLWNGRTARVVELGGGRARWVGEGPDGMYALGPGGALFRSGDRGHTFAQIGDAHASRMPDLRRCGWIAGALFAIASRELYRWDRGAWRPFPGAGRVADFASWGDGALVVQSGGGILRLASPRDRFWEGAVDEHAPKWPRVERAPDTAAAAPEHREEVYADLAREAALAHEDISAELRALHRADDLEGAIDNTDPSSSDQDAFAVLLDRLHAAGDPRAELGALEHVGKYHPAEMKEEKQRLIREVAGEVVDAGDLVDVRWRAGYLESLELKLQDVTSAEGFAPAVAVLDGESARFVRWLVVRAPRDGNLGAMAARIGARYRPAVQNLIVTSAEDAGVRVNLEAIWPAVPNLRTLEVDALHVHLGEVVLPRLTSMVIRAGALPPREARAIATARRPDLRRLAIAIGPRRTGGTARVDDLGPIFDGAGLPRLERLETRHCELGDELLARLARSAIVGQLQVLDLSHGTITDDGARILVSHQFAFAHLANIILDDNLITPDGAALLAHSSLRISLGTQREDPGLAHLRVLP